MRLSFPHTQLLILRTGETAKQIFERAQLPNDVLGRIWNLADTEQKGHLGLTEFIIAMHLLASYKNGTMRALPQILPPGLYEAAARRGAPRQMTGSRPTSDGIVASAIRPQISGSGYPGQVPRTPQATFQQAAPTGDQWAVSPQDKAQFDQIYATIDIQKRGYITGEQAVGFFSNSRLPEDALAQIWDLADINSEGQLNREEFAVAMYLIRQQRSKKDGREVLPQTLSPSLIPPSMRRQPIAPQQPTAPAFDNAVNITQPKSASEDLFGLDAFSSPSAPPPIQSKLTGDSTANGLTPPRSQGSPAPQLAQQQPSHFKPFVPSSSFGQSMTTPQMTGTPSTASPTEARSVPPQQTEPSTMDDLLGDNDPEVSKRLTNETSELGNLSNQVSTLTGQMQEITAKRGSTEQDLSQAQAQKQDFESRLTQLRSSYEQEVKEVHALEERLAASRSETRKLSSDMAMIEGTHQDLQNQHRQMGDALNMDQQENASLKERISQMNVEISQLKPQLEKLRSDARQQKGLVAINKKQLATNEAEREKIKGDMDGASKENEEATRELEESEREIEAASQVRSPIAAAASPTASTASMNPFFRRTSNAAPTTRGISSPSNSQTTIASPNHNAFDSFFGTSVASTIVPPPTSFMNETPTTLHQIPHRAVASNSNQSSEDQGFPTPTTSSPPSNLSDSPPASSEPPAPPQSRQITSSFLPLRPNLERSGSESSSIKVVPPASRMGEESQSGFETPTLSASEAAIPESPKQHFEDPAGDVQHQDFAVPEELALSSGLPSASRDVPGAFPGDETPLGEPQPNAYQASPYSSSVLDPRVDATTQSATTGLLGNPSNTHNNISSSPNPFSKLDIETRGHPSANDDFESAFVGFGDKGKAPDKRNGTISNGFGNMDAPKPHGEFPPIQEYGVDDSDSESDRGFDDHSTSHSANRIVESGPHEALQAHAPATLEASGLSPNRPPLNAMESNASQLPTPGAQPSPPTYDQTIGGATDASGHRTTSNQFPAEYGGLLPSRDDPTLPHMSPPPSTSNVASQVAISSPAGIDRGLNFFGNDTPEHAAGHAPMGSTFVSTHSPMSPGASTAAPFAFTNNASQPQQYQVQPSIPPKTAPKDDFDDEFGDLTEAQEAEDKVDDEFTSHHRNEFDEFNPVFDSPAASRHTAQSSSTFLQTDSFTNFPASNIGGSGLGSSTHMQPPQETPSHDWDAIFAGLDTTQQNDGPKPDLPPRQPGFTPSKPAPSGFGSETSNLKRPEPKRAMTEEHDDPIVKRLTGMGYDRQDSVKALEDFDYNIDKVS